MQTARARRRGTRDGLPAVKRPAGLTQAEARGAVAVAIPAQAPVTAGQQPHHVPAPGPRAGAGHTGGLPPWQEGRGRQGGDPVLPTHAQLQRRPAVHHRHCHDPACDAHGDLPRTVRQKCTEASGNTDRRLPDDLSHRNSGLGGTHKALIVGYAFHFPHLLSPQIQHSAHRTLYRRHILGIVLRGPALCLVAAIFSLFFVPLSYLLMATVILLPYVSKAASWCRDRLLGHREPSAHPVEVFTFDLHEPLSKERVEAFSDGVYAIVATLLILDICEDNVPDPKNVKERFGGSLVAALSVFGPRFLAYFGSFATVALLWFAHHSLFLHVRKATQAMGLLNTFSLAFVGGLPLAYQQTSAFARQPRDELERVRVSCAIIFLASIFQLAIWTTALLHQAETLQPSVWFGGQEHVLMFAKLALYPCASLLAFASTCLLSRFSAGIFHLTQIAVPCAFLLLRLLVGLALTSLRFLRGLARPQRSPPAPTGQDDPQAQLLPSPC
ncbi:endosomal/lysosomal potassium channel TMEM175 isoform X4 [Cebus imitator]|uniref:endosomal/lysosomal potassium channel TMEM175 isoform X4 n=1 Tax=Cebus imitator TaxID=2715852 RepID=UPI001898D00C|nr:endosomal/lysosomal potassium channel TMEM175 isoform X4 [Cebus imitator]